MNIKIKQAINLIKKSKYAKLDKLFFTRLAIIIEAAGLDIVFLHEPIKMIKYALILYENKYWYAAKILLNRTMENPYLFRNKKWIKEWNEAIA